VEEEEKEELNGGGGFKMERGDDEGNIRMILYREAIVS
jgi:hypothetical protein